MGDNISTQGSKQNSPTQEVITVRWVSFCFKNIKTNQYGKKRETIRRPWEKIYKKGVKADRLHTGSYNSSMGKFLEMQLYRKKIVGLSIR